MNTQTISLKKEINKKLGLRESVKPFFKKLEKQNANKFVFDFEGVNFMGRSFAQEYIHQKNNFNKEIIEKNKSIY